ncbi:MAG: polysaccharide biosynthesis/export family protein [Candidatus Omnitrophota bacterium]
MNLRVIKVIANDNFTLALEFKNGMKYYLRLVLGLLLIGVLFPVPNAQAVKDPIVIDEHSVEGTVVKKEGNVLYLAYTAKDGDTVSSVAEKFYGDVSKWTLVYEPNEDKIKDPCKIEAGTPLIIMLTVLEQSKASVIQNEQQIAGAEYTINPGDVLYITVWQEDDLRQEVIVRPDGRISFPLAGEVPAQGLTFTQLKAELTRRFEEYLRYPEVSISLRKLGGRKVIVLGEVRRPGVYAVSGGSTILEAIGMAGGFTTHSVPSSTILISGGFQNPKGKRINLSRAIAAADKEQNIPLQPEDVIFIPKKFIANVNYVVDQILNPIKYGATTKIDVQTAD